VRLLRRAILILLALYIAAWGYRIYIRKYYVWLPGYLSWLFEADRAAAGPVHVFFVFADHFEPGQNYALVERWLKEYPTLAARHHDRGGRAVQHTWFYPAEQPIDRNLAALRQLVQQGYGEVELHLHHSNDTEESARRRFAEGIAWFHRFGFLQTADGATHFAFIHGVWGLDNSNGPQYCGVNRELALLRDLGCYADFTFPSIYWQSQPPTVNDIYESFDDERPKSYDRGEPVRAGIKPEGDLMIFQGPLLLVPVANPARLFFFVEDGEIHPSVPVGPHRVDWWTRSRIHVIGRLDWQFVKVHTHGAESDADATETLGPHFESALRRLETAYNDGTHYVLHYVTAREAFNLVRAAADGKTGDPRLYYDYVVPPYVAGGRR
jgi:hypothetical protein